MTKNFFSDITIGAHCKGSHSPRLVNAVWLALTFSHATNWGKGQNRTAATQHYSHEGTKSLSRESDKTTWSEGGRHDHAITIVDNSPANILSETVGSPHKDGGLKPGVAAGIVLVSDDWWLLYLRKCVIPSACMLAMLGVQGSLPSGPIFHCLNFNQYEAISWKPVLFRNKLTTCQSWPSVNWLSVIKVEFADRNIYFGKISKLG